MKSNEIILWRHADAEIFKDGMTDIERKLTDKGKKQAQRMAKWLGQHLQSEAIIFSSPAIRARQTAENLHRKFLLESAIGPDTTADVVKAAVEHELASADGRHRQILLVGHQPWLGEYAANLLQIGHLHLDIKKGSVWWLREDKYQHGRFKLISVTSPALL